MLTRLLGARRPTAPFWILFCLLVVTALVPLKVSNPYYLTLFTSVFIYYLVIMGSNILQGYAGQVSFAPVALFAVGGYVAGILSRDYHISFWLASVFALVAVAVVAFITTLPALRLTLFQLAVLTIMLVLLVQEMILSFPSVTGGWEGLSGIPMPTLGPFTITPQWQYLLALATAVAAFWLGRNLIVSQHGRRFQLMSDNEVASESIGISTFQTKALAFVVSSLPIGFAGALLAGFSGYLTESMFTFNLVLLILLGTVIGGYATLWGPVIGAILIVGLPIALQPLVDWQLLVWGGVLLAFMWVLPDGLSVGIETLQSRRRKGQVKPTQPIRTMQTPPKLREAHSGPLLTADKLTKTFGGLTAVDAVDFEIKPGLCYGVIGPNGSGKTTLLNLINRYYKPSSGSFVVLGRQRSSLSTHSLARLGVARTFQVPRVCGRMSVLDNVMVGHATFCKATAFESVLRLPRSNREENDARERALRALTLVGLADQAGRKAEDLTHADLRMVELARALMLEPHLLLLDEPASGLDRHQIQKLLDVMRSIRDAGTTLMLVEHNVGLVTSIADSLLVLEYGQLIAEGPPAQVVENPRVKEIYLGAKRPRKDGVGSEMTGEITC
ncbi:MAG: branched-chain amino acid ABC transporter ATP-binding protein/permease [Chloroflexota bacterium]|nr:MAG: branched-chain amino acid ABC transporter ATP-binding protein/permease [Chloroflexota bacterium]